MANRKIAYILGTLGASGALAYGLQNNKIDQYRGAVSSAAPIISKTSQGSQTESLQTVHFTSYDQAINRARDLVSRFKDEVGAPGIVIGVSVDGRTVWSEGFGMADVENKVPCHSDTVMRIASISKSMTMAVVAKLWEDGKIDLDKPVQDYVPQFPVKTYDGQEVEITTRLLISHLAGIRHYLKKGEQASKEVVPTDTMYKEFFLKDKFESVGESLKLFQDDELMSRPGTSFHYTTHGWTLISAVVESAAKKSFPKLMQDFFKIMGMNYTYLDENDPIIYNRSRYYMRNKRGRLTNVPYADNSYKWAGGGFVSTVGDLLHFCNAMLLSYQQDDNSSLKTQPCYLTQETTKTLWTPHPVTQKSATNWGRDSGYGMGWFVIPERKEFLGGSHQQFSVGHTGGAVGASSVILVIPHTNNTNSPNGVAVAIITNLQDVGMQNLALEVSQQFTLE